MIYSAELCLFNENTLPLPQLWVYIERFSVSNYGNIIAHLSFKLTDLGPNQNKDGGKTPREDSYLVKFSPRQNFINQSIVWESFLAS